MNKKLTDLFPGFKDNAEIVPYGVMQSETKVFQWLQTNLKPAETKCMESNQIKSEIGYNMSAYIILIHSKIEECHDRQLVKNFRNATVRLLGDSDKTTSELAEILSGINQIKTYMDVEEIDSLLETIDNSNLFELIKTKKRLEIKNNIMKEHNITDRMIKDNNLYGGRKFLGNINLRDHINNLTDKYISDQEKLSMTAALLLNYSIEHSPEKSKRLIDDYCKNVGKYSINSQFLASFPTNHNNNALSIGAL